MNAKLRVGNFGYIGTIGVTSRAKLIITEHFFNEPPWPPPPPKKKNPGGRIGLKTEGPTRV